MIKPLNADMERCMGVGCDLSVSCKRNLTLAIDHLYGQRLLSYHTSLQSPVSGHCFDYLEDKSGD